ncbi:MAG: hypothetical protein OIF57_09895 [Marinobacterium sp.]|nr:hypothetical protein [Marinobacterium sp.]
MSQETWKAVPTMSEEYFSENSVFLKVEDICREEMVTRATDEAWLKFTSNWSWPGPETRLLGGPVEVAPTIGTRPIPSGSIEVDIQAAFEKAQKRLHETNGGDKFIGTIQLSWPGGAPNICTEPFYTFTTNLHNVIHVGAYTGEVTGP